MTINNMSNLIIDGEYEGYIGLVKHSVRVRNVIFTKVIFELSNQSFQEMSIEEFESTFTPVIYA